MKKLLFVLVFLLLPLVMADGGDVIFEELGMDKPSEWSSWSRSERFDYLDALGLSPGADGKYQADAGDLTEYFSLLGLEEPVDWDTMTFDEKKVYVSGVEASVVVEESYDEERRVVDYIAFFSVFVMLLLLIVGLFYRKLGKFVAYYLLPLVLLFGSVVLYSRGYFALLGNIAEYLLVFILFVKPLAVITKLKLLRRFVLYRRELGVAVFWFFLFHIGSYFVLGMSLDSFLNGKMFFGLVAGLGLLVLALTSNNFSVKLLKRNWKKLQYFVYFVLFGVLLHSNLMRGEGLFEFYLIFGLFVVLKGLEWGRKFFKWLSFSK
jgi:methionine sulfoxide reductase heme-binding subunit